MSLSNASAALLVLWAGMMAGLIWSGLTPRKGVFRVATLTWSAVWVAWGTFLLWLGRPVLREPATVSLGLAMMCLAMVSCDYEAWLERLMGRPARVGKEWHVRALGEILSMPAAAWAVLMDRPDFREAVGRRSSIVVALLVGIGIVPMVAESRGNVIDGPVMLAGVAGLLAVLRRRFARPFVVSVERGHGGLTAAGVVLDSPPRVER